MDLGVVFPQTEIGNDPSAIRDYAQAAEGAGYGHLLVYDHVLGTDPDRPGGWSGPYTHESPFHEPLVLFGYLAAVTERLELVTGILILPQRQTVLVAKQAAEVAILSGGRLRLGVGVGWNAVEYEGLGENFGNRGRRIEEQIALLRALWSQSSISFEGHYHRVTKAGINPRPAGDTIPIWMGGSAEPVIERAGRLADGWFPQYRDPAELTAGIERLHESARAAGRDPTTIGIESGISIGGEKTSQTVEFARRLEEAGATHLSVNSMGAGLTSPQQHIEAIRAFADAYRTA